MNPPSDGFLVHDEHEAAADTPLKSSLRITGWVCVAAAICHVLALLVILYATRLGDLGAFSPAKLMKFVPDNQLIWRTMCLLSSLSSFSTVMVVLMLREVVTRRARLFMRVALILAVIGCAADLQSHFSLMVLFSDLATEIKSNGSYVRQELVQLAWMTVNQALSQTLLLTNLMYSLAGVLSVASLLMTRTFPQWLFWMGLPIWLIALSATLVAFAGQLIMALSLFICSVVGFIVWTVAIALIIDIKNNPKVKTQPISSEI